MSSPGNGTGGLRRDILSASVFAGAAAVFWILLYLGTTARVKELIIVFVSVSTVAAFSAYLAATRLLGSRFAEGLRLRYLMFGVLIAVPVYLHLVETYVNTRYGDIVTTKRLSGLAITCGVALLVVLAFLALGVAIKRWLPRFERPAFLLVALGSLVLPHLATDVHGRAAFDFQRGELVSRATQRRSAPPGGKIAVLGIDGGTWDVMAPLLRAGRLPHLSAIIESGSYGQLISDNGARSPVVWTTILTGRPPAVHGIDSWDRSLSTNRRVKTVWNILNEFGRRAIVLNVPGSFPAEVVQGAMLAGFPAPAPEPNNYGWFLSTEDREAVDIPRGGITFERSAASGGMARAVLEVTLPSRLDSLIEDPERLLSQRYNLQNFFVNFLIRQERLSSARGQGITLFLRARDDGSVDLGWSAGRMAVTVRPGEWSRPLYLTVGGVETFALVKLIRHDRSGTKIYVSPLFRAGLTRSSQFLFSDRRGEVLQASPSDDYVIEGPGFGAMENDELVRANGELQREVFRRQAAYVQALARTSGWDALIAVFTITDRIQHSFWKFREPGRFPRVTTEQAQEFGRAIDDAYVEVDRQIGEIVSRLDDDDLLVIVSDHGFRSAEAGSSSRQSGAHAREGIFILRGKNVRRSGRFVPEKMARAEILQVTPTILYLAGLPVGEDMAGPVIEAAISEQYLRNRPVQKIASYEEGGSAAHPERTIGRGAKEQLRSLGYVQ
jgi:type I phosphodiesterase/nucleotide pyrophosphatase